VGEAVVVIGEPPTLARKICAAGKDIKVRKFCQFRKREKKVILWRGNDFNRKGNSVKKKKVRDARGFRDGSGL